MLRARSENTRGVANHHRKSGENDGIIAAFSGGKQELQQPSNNDPSTPLLKDKDVNQQRSIQISASTKTNEKDRIISTATTAITQSKGICYNLCICSSAKLY